MPIKISSFSAQSRFILEDFESAQECLRRCTYAFPEIHPDVDEEKGYIQWRTSTDTVVQLSGSSDKKGVVIFLAKGKTLKEAHDKCHELAIEIMPELQEEETERPRRRYDPDKHSYISLVPDKKDT